MEDYSNSIKSYKSMMYLAWRHGDRIDELRAYQGLAQQYFYTKDIKKCEFFTDRVLRCKCERKDSKILQIVLSQLKYREKSTNKHIMRKKEIH